GVSAELTQWLRRRQNRHRPTYSRRASMRWYAWYDMRLVRDRGSAGPPSRTHLSHAARIGIPPSARWKCATIIAATSGSTAGIILGRLRRVGGAPGTWTGRYPTASAPVHQPLWNSP